MIHVLDTSAVLNGALHQYSDIYISPIVLQELEHIKTEQRNESIKYKAREAIRALTTEKYSCPIYSQAQINKKLKKYNFLSEINDHKILCEAVLLAEAEGHTINFVTADAAQALFASRLPKLNVIYSVENEQEDSDYCGWSKYYPTEFELNILYSDPRMNILKCKTNEFAKVYDDTKLKDVLFWTGEEYRPLKYKDMKNPYLEEVLRPRNTEQKMAFDLLQNQNVRVKLLMSAWGGGKTLMALTYALEQVYKGRFAKLIFIRNNIIVADTNDIGFLPGQLVEKMSIWGGPLADHLGGQEMLTQLIADGVIEIYPLSHIRGRSIKNAVVICDECENMNDKLVTLLMSRIEENSELIFCGDVAQIDDKKFEKNNGIKAMIKHLSGNPLFGTVKLIKSERGPVSALCDLIRPPI